MAIVVIMPEMNNNIYRKGWQCHPCRRRLAVGRAAPPALPAAAQWRRPAPGPSAAGSRWTPAAHRASPPPITGTNHHSGREYSPIRTRWLANKDASTGTRQSGHDYSPIRTRVLANQGAITRQSGRDYSPIRTRLLANQKQGQLYLVFTVLWIRNINMRT